MTEVEWDASTDPRRMFDHLRGYRGRLARWLRWGAAPESTLPERKLALFLCAITWVREAALPPDVADLTRQFLEPVERLAHVNPQKPFGLVVGRHPSSLGGTLFDMLHEVLHPRWEDFHHIDWMFGRGTGSTLDVADELREQADNQPFADALRCIFGSPFRTSAFVPEWRTATVVQLAAAIEDGKAFDRMPVLADALEEAGCADARALAHCRADTAHYLGCWVLDAINRPEASTR